MSTGRAPPDDSGRTVIRPTAAGPTVIAPRFSGERTVLASNPEQHSLHTVVAGFGPPAGAAADPLHAETEDADFPGDNRLLSAAFPLLALLARLQAEPPAGGVQPAPFRAKVAALIDRFEQRATDRGTEPALVAMGRVMLFDAAEDIGRHLPSSDKRLWRDAEAMRGGGSFFATLNRLLADPAPPPDLLVLAHTLLALGYKGQYRALGGDEQGLSRVQEDVLRTLRHIRPQAEDRPKAQASAGRASRRGWVLLVALPVLLAVVFAGYSTILDREADRVVARLKALSPPPAVVIERASLPSPAAAAPAVATNSALQAAPFSEALAPEIAAGNARLAEGDGALVLTLNNAILFAPGQATLQPGFEALARRLADAGASMLGAVRVIGHTDTVKPRRSSPWASNEDLSLARAQAVADALQPVFGADVAITAEGRGEADPIADNATAEGRDRNRRIELMLLPKGRT